MEVAASAGPVDGHAPVGRPAQLTGGRPAELHLEEEAAEVEPPTAAAALAGREQLREGFGAQGVGGVSGGDDVLAVQPTGVTFEAAVQADATGGPGVVVLHRRRVLLCFSGSGSTSAHFASIFALPR